MRFKQRVLKACLLSGLIWFYACATTLPVLTDSQYLERADRFMQQKEYAAAREEYTKLREIYPDSPLMAETRLGTADSYFYDEKYVEAIAGYEELLKYHPINKLAPKARYYLGLCYFNQMLSLDRDQSNTNKALEEFDKLLKQYPDSSLVEQAREKIAACRDQLARHEFYVGSFYFNRGEYLAAIGRFKYGLLKYPYTEVAEQSTYYLAESYWQLGKYKEGRELFRLFLSRFPGSRFGGRARNRLASSE
jgi:outer membrane protein assembly factor BamD